MPGHSAAATALAPFARPLAALRAARPADGRARPEAGGENGWGGFGWLVGFIGFLGDVYRVFCGLHVVFFVMLKVFCLWFYGVFCGSTLGFCDFTGDFDGFSMVLGMVGS